MGWGKSVRTTTFRAAVLIKVHGKDQILVTTTFRAAVPSQHNRKTHKNDIGTNTIFITGSFNSSRAPFTFDLH